MPRKVSSVDLYHVVSRGVGGQIIFEDDADFRHFLVLLKRTVENHDMKLAAWCLMDNHVHLIVKSELGVLSDAMRYLLGHYALDANKRYQRSGHLFQGAFSSFPIEEESYLAAAIQYVHFNPVRAKIAAAPSDYPWSSAREYRDGAVFIDPSLMVELPAEPLSPAAAHCFLYRGSKMSDLRAGNLVCSVLGVDSPTEVKSFPREKRDQAILKVASCGIRNNQIARLIGISPSVVCRILSQ